MHRLPSTLADHADQLARAALLARDQRDLEGHLRGLGKRLQRDQPIDKGLAKWEKRFADAERRRDALLGSVPALEYPPDLPVSRHHDRIIDAIRAHQVVIVCGDTGSGKTTQLPKMMFEAGAGHTGRIGVTQPRRLAATSMARRVAEECRVDLGGAVGVQVRFDDKTSDRTRIQFMTDGLLLAQLPSDPDWLGYDALIIDEAHERSLNIDFILGCLRNLLQRRPDLKVLISSATLDAKRFSEFFHDAPVLEVEGRLYPIDDVYLPEPAARDLDLPDQVLEALHVLDTQHGPRDTLVFLPGEREIRDTARKLEPRYRDRADVLPLFARLGAADQQRVFASATRRRIVLATNVAETSLTLPGIRAVIDTGQVRLQRFHPQSRIQRLVTEQVSRASAKQRRGRCGRTGPGVCLRLYGEEALEQAPEYTDPEIRRSSLAEVILRMAVLGLPPLQEFPLLDPPKGAQVSEGYRTLFDIGAMTKDRRLTPRGRLLATFNLEPRLARMLEEGHTEQVLPAVLVCAAFLSIQDPRERPADKTAEADRAHAAWVDPSSDFLGTLNLWNALCGQPSRSKRNRFCNERFLHPRRVQEWINLVDDLRNTCRDHKWTVPKSIGELELLDTDGLHRALLSGMPRSVGQREENREFRNPGGQTFLIFPGSALSKKPPKWVMAFTLLQTSRLFARECAALRPEWVEEVAPHLCRYQYERPVWNPTRGFVEAEERVSLGQLTLRQGDRVHYGRIDPEEARRIFIRDALVPGDLKISHPSFRAYLDVRASLDTWERKLRRPGYFLGSDALAAHMERTLPADIHTQKDFKAWSRKADWVPRVSDLMEGESIDEYAYPDTLRIRGVDVAVEYAYTPDQPETDGVTFVVRETDLPDLPDELLEWTIPAWLTEKTEALIRSLEKSIRVQCNPVARTAEEAAAWFHDNGFLYTHSLHHALAAFLAAKLDRILAAPDLNPDRIAPHLRTRLRVVDSGGQTVHEGDAFPGAGALPPDRGPVASSASGDWHRSHLKDWPDILLPESIDHGGRERYPALVDEGAACGLRLFPDRREAEEAHRAGVVRLFTLHHPDPVKYLQKQLPLPTSVQLDLSTLPSAGGDALTDVLDGILREALDVLHHPPRDAEAFGHACERARGELFEVAEKRGRELQEIFRLRSEVNDALDPPPPPHAAADLDLQQTTLWSPGWCADPENLRRYPRYLKGILVRLERARREPEKDRRKQTDLEPALEQLSAATPELSPARLRTAFRKIEELRLSVFAPELRPHEKISVQRFERWLRPESD